MQRWMVEGGTPNTLFRRGFTKASLPTGIVIVVDGYQAKDGSQKANGRDLTFQDGRKLFMGSSGTGAPTDGRGACSVGSVAPRRPRRSLRPWRRVAGGRHSTFTAFGRPGSRAGRLLLRARVAAPRVWPCGAWGA